MSGITLVYLRSGGVLATRRPFADWRAIQDAYPDDYMTSLGPWSLDETIEFIEEDWTSGVARATERLRHLSDGETVDLTAEPDGPGYI